MSLLRLDLPAVPASIASARDSLEELRDQLDPGSWHDLRLLVSEVVTNAVRHSGTGDGARVLLVADRKPDCVRVEVHDEGEGFVASSSPEPAASGTSGWGLFLVDRLASRWGTEAGPDAHVWFELATG